MFDCETNHGKRTLTLELSRRDEAGEVVKNEEDCQRLWELLKVADVIIDGFSKGKLAKYGFSMEQVLHENPHLVYVNASCFGHEGPLSHGKGFQQNANFACGVAGIEDEELLSYQLVSQVDYVTGFMGAYGVILGLIDRQKAAKGEYGGTEVQVSLCQAATWMGLFGAKCPGPFEWLKCVTRLMWFSDRRSTTVGDISYLPPDQTVQMSVTPPFRHGFERWWPDTEKTQDLVVKKK